MEFKEIVDFLGVAGRLAAPFTPIGGGVVLASEALKKFEEFNSDSLQADFMGLNALSLELKNMVETGNFDADKIKQISASLETLSTVLNKFSKMIG